MEDKKISSETDNNNSWREIKIFVVFLASGAFAKVHKRFMAPSSDFFADHFANQIHHCLHFIIGVVLQFLILGWLVWIGWRIMHMFKEQEPSEIEEIKLKNETLKKQLELQQQDQQSSPADKK